VHRCGCVVSCRRQSSHAPTAAFALDAAPLVLDFSKTERAFRHYSTLELVRSAAVLTACAQPQLVRRAEYLINLSKTVVGTSATRHLVRKTIFAQFVAGEDASGIAPTLDRLRAAGVGGILDFAAEGDVASAVEHNQPAREYNYAGEAVCDANRDVFLSAVQAVHDTTPEGFAAVKVTALGDPALLERVSGTLVALRGFFARLDSAERGWLTRDEFATGWTAAFRGTSREGALRLFDSFDSSGDGGLDVLEFSNALPLDAIAPLVATCREHGPLYHAALDEGELGALRRMMGRLEAIASRARELDVRLMIDAEHAAFQPAIDHAVLALQRAHNTRYPAVFGTFQAYLVENASKMALDLERARREGWHMGAKLVRGAYMAHERERAAALGTADPIHPSAEATHAAYDAALEALLDHCPSPERTSIMVATHNQQSIEHAARLATRAGGVPRERVFFGQLLGMADHTTFTLAAHGLKAYKYVPYGPVDEVLPYLIRRAHENADALSGVPWQRAMILREVRRRLVGF